VAFIIEADRGVRSFHGFHFFGILDAGGGATRWYAAVIDLDDWGETHGPSRFVGRLVLIALAVSILTPR